MIVPLNSVMLSGERCLLCASSQTENVHFPVSKGMGGRSKEEDEKLPKIRLCVPCNRFGLHKGDHEIVEALIERSPLCWKVQGTWEGYQEVFELWLSLWRYKHDSIHGSGSTCTEEESESPS